jgi:2-aminoadipate transaminase
MYQEALQYGITEGYEPLRLAIKERFTKKYSVGRDYDDFIVVSGGQQGIELSTKILVNEGDTILCESPSFIGALNGFRSYNTRLVGIPMDADGMDIDALEKALKTEPNVRLIYTIPTFHNPCGSTMSLERRKRLLELAKKYNVLILEDSPYFELRYSGTDLPTIKSMDTEGRVIFAGSFSKVIAPGIRIGFVCAHRDICSKLTVAKQVSDVHTNAFFQILVYKFLKECDIDAHIEDCRKLYRMKRDRMLAAMEKHMMGKATWNVPNGGLFLWAELPNGYDGFELCRRLKENKIACVPGNTFSVDESEVSRGFRLNFSLPSDDQIDRGISILGRVLSDYVK